MLKAITPEDRVEFISKFDEGEPKTTFVLQPLAGVEMPLLNNTNDVIEMVIKTIVAIRNLPEGFTGPEDFVRKLDTLTLAELIDKCNRVNKLTRQDEKNF